jgi:hypothetical protein
MQIILFTIALAAILAVVVPAEVIAASNNSTSTTSTTPTHSTTKTKTTDGKSNYLARCLKLKDKKTRSLVCPGVFPKSETSISLYG